MTPKARLRLKLTTATLALLVVAVGLFVSSAKTEQESDYVSAPVKFDGAKNKAFSQPTSFEKSVRNLPRIQKPGERNILKGLLEPAVRPDAKSLIPGESAALKKAYAGFLRKHGLSDSDAEQLMSLAAQRALLIYDRGEKLKSGEFKTVADANAVFNSEKDRLDSQMREFLGDARYEDFLSATERIPLQQNLLAFASEAERQGFGLGERQIEVLTDIYHDEYKAEGVDIYFSAAYSPIPSPKELGADLSNRSKANERIRQQAAEFMSPAQLAALQKWQVIQLRGMQNRVAAQRLQAEKEKNNN